MEGEEVEHTRLSARHTCETVGRASEIPVLPTTALLQLLTVSLTESDVRATDTPVARRRRADETPPVPRLLGDACDAILTAFVGATGVGPVGGVYCKEGKMVVLETLGEDSRSVCGVPKEGPRVRRKQKRQ